MRSLEFDPNEGASTSDVGWGVQISGHAMLGRDNVTGTFVTGEGLGRHLLELMQFVPSERQ